MKTQALITGASGLLGRALVKEFLKHDINVIAQYHSNKPSITGNCQWLPADFSTLEGISEFLQSNRGTLSHSTYLINNYGPITYKDISQLQADDFLYDYHHNVITAFEITRFLIACSPSLKVVCSMGFEHTAEIKPYRKILTYASAKNTLVLMHCSFANQYTHIRFPLIDVPTLKGAAVPSKSGQPVAPAEVARKIYTSMI